MAGPPNAWAQKLAAGLLSQPTQPQRGILSAFPGDQGGLLSQSPEQLMATVFGKYQALNRNKDIFSVTQAPQTNDGRQLEYYPPWERDNPQPGKATVELYNTKESPEVMQNLVAGDMMHYMGSVDPRNNQTVDPTFRALKTELLQNLTPQQLAVDREAYERDKRFYGENPPSFEDWMDFSRGDAYIRGYLTPDAHDEWRKRGGYTPKQKDILEKLRTYMQRGSLSPGMR